MGDSTCSQRRYVHGHRKRLFPLGPLRPKYVVSPSLDLCPSDPVRLNTGAESPGRVVPVRVESRRDRGILSSCGGVSVPVVTSPKGSRDLSVREPAEEKF